MYASLDLKMVLIILIYSAAIFALGYQYKEMQIEDEEQSNNNDI